MAGKLFIFWVKTMLLNLLYKFLSVIVLQFPSYYSLFIFFSKKIEFLDSDISFPIHLNHLRPTPFRDARKAAQSILDRKARAPPRFRYMEDDRKQTNHVLKEISLDTAMFSFRTCSFWKKSVSVRLTGDMPESVWPDRGLFADPFFCFAKLSKIVEIVLFCNIVDEHL